MKLRSRWMPVMVPALLLLSCHVPPQTETALWLGTACSVTVYGRARKDTFAAAFERVEEIHRLMSLQEPESELNRINRSAGLEGSVASADTAYVIAEALRFSRLSGGSFDLTVGPLVELWGIGSAAGRTVPSAGAIAAALALVDYTAVSVTSRRIHLNQGGMKIDLGGIAKGYAADEAAAVLRDSGVTGALLDFGGNILVVGEKPDGSPWRIGVQNPLEERGRYIGVLAIDRGTVVTSGVYERFFEQDGIRYHHILDPRTGYPAQTGLLSATVVTDRSVTADALSTAIFVMGAEAGIPLIESLPNVEALFVTEDKRILMTSGLEDRFTVVDPRYRL